MGFQHGGAVPMPAAGQFAQFSTPDAAAAAAVAHNYNYYMYHLHHHHQNHPHHQNSGYVPTVGHPPQNLALS